MENTIEMTEDNNQNHLTRWKMIRAELDRLQVSTDYDPISGLSVIPFGITHVKLFDDYFVDRIYNVETLISLLKAEDHTEVTLASTYDPERKLEDIRRNIWDVIRPAQED